MRIDRINSARAIADLKNGSVPDGAGSPFPSPPGSAIRHLMHYWELIADSLKREGWSLGWFGFTTAEGVRMWSADAKCNDGPRIIVQAESLGTAFVELE